MIPYSRPNLSDFYTPFESKLAENHTLHSGTYLYSSYVGVPPPPPELLTQTFHPGVACEQALGVGVWVGGAEVGGAEGARKYSRSGTGSINFVTSGRRLLNTRSTRTVSLKKSQANHTGGLV